MLLILVLSYYESEMIIQEHTLEKRSLCMKTTSLNSQSDRTNQTVIVNIMAPEWGGKLVFTGDAIVPIG